MKINEIHPNIITPLNQDNVRFNKNSKVTDDLIAKLSIKEERTLQDAYVKSSEYQNDIYSRDNIINQLKASEQQRIESFQKMIQDLIFKQTDGYKLSISDGSKTPLVGINVTQETIDSAKVAISEDGEYGINAVADRIMNMAKALAGGDNSKLELLRNAVSKGFGYVENLYRDNYPEVCKDTYSEIMNRFDKWQKSIDDSSEEA